MEWGKERNTRKEKWKIDFYTTDFPIRFLDSLHNTESHNYIKVFFIVIFYWYKLL